MTYRRGWPEHTVAGPDDNVTPTRRRPVFTLIAALTAAGAVATIGYLYDAGNDAGFEGFGALLFAGIFALLGLVLVLPASIIATVRKEPGYVVSWVAFIVCLLGFLAVT